MEVILQRGFHLFWSTKQLLHNVLSAITLRAWPITLGKIMTEQVTTKKQNFSANLSKPYINKFLQILAWHISKHLCSLHKIPIILMVHCYLFEWEKKKYILLFQSSNVENSFSCLAFTWPPNHMSWRCNTGTAENWTRILKACQKEAWL